MRFVFIMVAMVCVAFVCRAAEPPAIQSEPPVIAVCECLSGGQCLCPACECTVPVIASLPYDADHSCDKCGAFANVVERELGNGMHSHRCGNCGHEWYHADPGAVQYVAVPVNPFAVGDCPGGRCPPRIAGGVATATVVRSVYGLERTRVFDGERRPVRRLLGVVFRPFRALRGGGCCN